MTQASLSPELPGALGAEPPVPDRPRRAATSEAAVLMVAITSLALVIASLLLLGLITGNAIADASLGGFVSGVGIVIAAVGVCGVSYALVTARRAGYLDLALSSPAVASVAPAGMHVVPAVPADPGRRRRQQLEAERSARNRQARAIAAAAAPAAGKPRTWPYQRPTPRPEPQPQSAARPRQAPVAVAAPVRVAQPATPRPTPVHTARPASARPASVHTVPVYSRPAVPPSRAQAVSRPAITMPRAQMRQPRPGAWPSRAPVVRMTAAPMRRGTEATMFQVNAARVRAAATLRPR